MLSLIHHRMPVPTRITITPLITIRASVITQTAPCGFMLLRYLATNVARQDP